MTLSLMNSLEERFEHLRSEMNVSYQNLADLVGGISGDAIRKAVQRGSLKGKYIQVISDKLGINRTWLESGEGVMTVDVASEPTAVYASKYANESGLRMLRMIESYVPEEMQDVLGKIENELVDLYEYKELYYKAKEAYRPK